MLLVTPETSQRGSGTADRPQHCAHGCGVSRRQRHMRALAPGGGKSDLCDDRTRLRHTGARPTLRSVSGCMDVAARAAPAAAVRCMIAANHAIALVTGWAVHRSSHTIHKCDAWGEDAHGRDQSDQFLTLVLVPSDRTAVSGQLTKCGPLPRTTAPASAWLREAGEAGGGHAE